MYENIPLADLKQEFRNYMGCWKTLVFAGIVIPVDKCFYPVAIQIWASDTSEEQTDVFGFPEIPRNICMFKTTRWLPYAWPTIDQILDRESIQIDDMKISFEHFNFSRAAFLSQNEHNDLYPEALHQHVNIWPKLFIEGSFNNRDYLYNDFGRSIEEEFKTRKYHFPSLLNASSHLIGIKVASSYYWGVLCAALKIPLKLEAKVENLKLNYKLGIPKNLMRMPREMRYVAKSDLGERHELISMPSGKEQDNHTIFSSSIDLNPNDEVREVLLYLGNKVVNSVRIPQTKAGDNRIKVSKLKVKSETTSGKKSIFVAYGHDEAVRLNVVRLLEHLDLNPIILSERPDQGQTIIEKIEKYSSVNFAVILLTPDDIGGEKSKKYEELSPRARQNVILELGYFIGKIGRENVASLYAEGVELPSDYHGVLYTPIDKHGAWKLKLAKELKAAGYDIDLNKLSEV